MTYLPRYVSPRIQDTWSNSKEAIEARTQAISTYLTQELQDLNVDTVRTDISTSSTVTDVLIWDVEQSGENAFTVTYEVDQQIKEGDQTRDVSETYTVTVHVDADTTADVTAFLETFFKLYPRNGQGACLLCRGKCP